jgi:hypothetical protein
LPGLVRAGELGFPGLVRAEHGSVAGRQYRGFLQDASAALELGMPNFIEQDFTRPGDIIKLAGLLPLLPRVNLANLLLQHDSR